MPEAYEMDYLVYSASSSLSEQAEIWHTDYVEVIKLMMFRKFDNWLQEQYINKGR